MGEEIGQNTAWFYCLKHAQVEREDGCKATDRLGPYPTREAAEHGLQSLHEREQRLRDEDRAWSDGDEPA